MVAKPIAVAAFVAICFLAAACSPVSSQQADRNASESDVDEPSEPAAPSPTAPGEVQDATPTPPQVDDEPAAGSDTNLISTEERGGRNLGPDSDTDVGAQEGLGDDDQADTAPVDSSEPTATPPTVESTTPPEPQATPTAVPAPDPTPTPPVFAVPAPTTGPPPSEEIVVQGPDIDESESSAISNSGALACTLTESAIEFLDRGDLNRLGAVLLEASEVAAQTGEPEIAALASQLAAAGPNEDAGLAAIIATLNACAIYGYQV